MKHKVNVGTSVSVDGVTEDINAVIELHGDRVSITGEKPFGGIPLSFIPLPEGRKGNSYIGRANNLAELVAREEKIIFRMGSTPVCYYEYKDGWCHLYYDMEDE